MAQHLCRELGFSGQEAKRFVNRFFAEITSCLERGEAVQLSSLGRFEPVQRAERPGRSPLTGEPYTIPSHKAVKFMPSVRLQRTLRFSADKTGDGGSGDEGAR